LSAGTIDIALVVQLPLKRGSGLVFEKLLELPVGIVVPPRHRFARRRAVTLEEALREPLVPYIRKGYSDYHYWLGAVIKRARGKARLTTAVDGAVSLIAAVESGQGIGFAPSTIIAVAGHRVKFVPLSPAPPPLSVGYIVRATRRSDTLEKFIEALHSIPLESTGQTKGVSVSIKASPSKVSRL
jgi:DNA-binding transcriptional LysR family regulator